MATVCTGKAVLKAKKLGTQRPPVWHSCPDLHALPVLAKVSMSLQQSSAPGCSAEFEADDISIGQGASNVATAAKPWIGTARHSSNEKNVNNARMATIYTPGVGGWASVFEESSARFKNGVFWVPVDEPMPTGKRQLIKYHDTPCVAV